VIDADFCGQIEELGGLGLIRDGLGARLVERYELVESPRFSIGSAQEEEGLVVAWLVL
jgi:hypothetical protein